MFVGWPKVVYELSSQKGHYNIKQNIYIHHKKACEISALFHIVAFVTFLKLWTMQLLCEWIRLFKYFISWNVSISSYCIFNIEATGFASIMFWKRSLFLTK